MAIVITSPLEQNDFPGMVKNPVLAYKINTDQNVDQCRARLYVEDTPYSATWTFIAEIKAFPDENGDAFFYIDSLFEEDILQYDKPDLYLGDQVASKVCRRVKAEFYEFSNDDRVFVDEAYSLIVQESAIQEMSAGTDYLIKVESEAAIAAPTFKDGGANVKAATLLYQLGDEIWYEITADHDYDSVTVEEGKKLTIYEGAAPALTNSAIEGVLLGGRSFEYSGYELADEGQLLGGESQTFGGEGETFGGQ